MHRAQSKYGQHPRITWFGRGGTVAYVDYAGATESYFIGADGKEGFLVIPPHASEGGELTGFDTIDAGIEHALALAEKTDA